jgi:uncharacterized membrane protein YphA (DoxX/SURF4 family)
MKIAVIILRTLMGLLFIFASLTYFLNLIPVPEMTGPIKTFNEGLAAAPYFMTLLKTTELVCGILLVTGYFVPLALVLLAPVIVNIFFVHATMAPEGLPTAIIVVLIEAFLGYAYRKSYAPLFAARAAIN